MSGNMIRVIIPVTRKFFVTYFGERMKVIRLKDAVEFNPEKLIRLIYLFLVLIFRMARLWKTSWKSWKA